MPGKPEEPGPYPLSCDTTCSQSGGWDHQGCLGHFNFRYWGPRKVILGCFRNFSNVDLPLMESIDGLSVVGLQGLHCILAQSLIDLRRQEDRAIIPSNWLGRHRILRLWPKGRSGGIARPWRRWMPRGKCMYLIKLIKR